MWTAKTDQTGRMPRLIWDFARRTCHFVGFVMRWLIRIQAIKIATIYSAQEIWTATWQNQQSECPPSEDSWSGWSESSLGAQSLCWFCHVMAHISLEITACVLSNPHPSNFFAVSLTLLKLCSRGNDNSSYMQENGIYLEVTVRLAWFNLAAIMLCGKCTPGQ